MMISIKKDRIQFGNSVVGYNSHYVSPSLLQKLCEIWYSRIKELQDGGKTFLPYSVSEEYVEAFRATMEGSDVVLLCVTLDALANDPELDDLLTYMTAPLPVYATRSKPLLTVDKTELLDALSTCQVKE